MDGIVNDVWYPPKRDQNGIFHIDVMVSSINLMRFEATAKREGWELHNMVHDVQKLIEQSSHSMDLPRDELANEEGVTNLVPIRLKPYYSLIFIQTYIKTYFFLFQEDINS